MKIITTEIGTSNRGLLGKLYEEIVVAGKNVSEDTYIGGVYFIFSVK